MLEAMFKRRSVRVFENEQLSKETVGMLKDFVTEVNTHNTPFNHDISFFIVDGHQFDGKKLGTYGTVKNPQMVIGGFVEESFNSFLDYGYLLEELVLKMAKIDIASVWEEGKYVPSTLGVEEQEGKIIPAIIPLGYPKGKVLKKRQFHINPKKEQRKDIRELAFVGKGLKPMNESDLHHEHIRAVQIAPSSSNKQPWRFVVMKKQIHIYLKPTKGYGKDLPKDIQAIDIGIALRHLTFSLEEHHIVYSIKKNLKTPTLEGAEYICTLELT